jgi:hypothetical protein
MPAAAWKVTTAWKRAPATLALAGNVRATPSHASFCSLNHASHAAFIYKTERSNYF